MILKKGLKLDVRVLLVISCIRLYLKA